ncbi:hypothetical protein Patl1_23645 [Pistacia atlantica]|uniref:Uncharacterized protein n=1 Tax=Pistacia atlantica TaxID=434234 RepID=A0ACC0ZUA4_9ROSI|nr:hypothetical protein Patl1_23645 [Pistacia atlantica]
MIVNERPKVSRSCCLWQEVAGVGRCCGWGHGWMMRWAPMNWSHGPTMWGCLLVVEASYGVAIGCVASSGVAIGCVAGEVSGAAAPAGYWCALDGLVRRLRWVCNPGLCWVVGSAAAYLCQSRLCCLAGFWFRGVVFPCGCVVVHGFLSKRKLLPVLFGWCVCCELLLLVGGGLAALCWGSFDGGSRHVKVSTVLVLPAVHSVYVWSSPLSLQHHNVFEAHSNRLSNEYEDGVEFFLEFAKTRCDDPHKIPCPCIRCGNMSHHTIQDVRDHLFVLNFDESYRIWVFHGEEVDDNDSRNINDSYPNESTFKEFDLTKDMVHDAHNYCNEDSKYIENTY